MLRIEETRSKTYEERYGEAVSQIPLYSSEWTNFNASDPGVTILENLSLFNTIQAMKIPEVPVDVLRRLYALAGFKAEKGKCSRVLIKTNGLEKPVTLPQNSRFSLGGMIFETNRNLVVGGKMTGLYSCIDGEFKDISFLGRQDIPMECAVFSDTPKEGDALYFICDSLPEEDKELILYAGSISNDPRNPIQERTENLFAKIRWECFTDTGFEEIKVRDFTGCFLYSGEIRLRMPAFAAEYEEAPTKGYCIRAVLERAEYDMPPRLLTLESFLFELWQKDTRAASMIFSKAGKISIKHPLAGDEYIIVFAKEEKGSSYRRYELSYDAEEEGRVVKYTPGKLGSDGRQTGFTIDFTGRYKPESDFKDPVRVVLYGADIMNRYEIGKVYGYDNQEFELPLKHLVADSFCLIARRKDENGEYLYDFVRPEKKDAGALYYHLLEDDGRMIIENAGRYIGADLFVASAAVTEGKKGNVRALSQFKPLFDVSEAEWFNPGPGTGGAFREKMSDVGVRFRKDVETPYTAVTASDYERIVSETPGLCVRKVNAVIDEAENLAIVAVLPGLPGDRPSLPKIYKDEITKRLDERRLLTTRIRVVSPKYVEINVKGTVYVKRHYQNPKEVIENEIRKIIDDVHSDRNFGDPLRFRNVFTAIEALDCVSYVYNLSLMPDDKNLAQCEDSDIFPGADVLCVAGEILIETVAGD